MVLTSIRRIAPLLVLTAVLTACASAPPTAQDPEAPGFAGGGAWLNSAPLTLAELRGRVVLVQFWTYGCINCRNTLPALRRWWKTYRDEGLVIVGVHTPEFASERELANVRQAVEREAITWPVVQDNDRAIWKAYSNHYWPHLYLLDHRGRLIYHHIGEGAYDETEQRIREALRAAGETP